MFQCFYRKMGQKAKIVSSLIERIAQRSRLNYCAICGKCLATCPTYNIFYDELHSPRGRLQLVSAYVHQELGADGPKFYEAISYCLLCGACETICPVDIKPNQAIMLIKNLPEIRKRCQPLEKVVLNVVLSNPRVIKMLSLPLRLYQRSGLNGLLRSINVPPGYLGRLRSFLPGPQGPPLTSRVKKMRRPSNFNGHRALLFPGCAMNFLLPDISYATYQLLLRAGYEVIVPAKFYCCGAPHIHEGYEEKAQELASKNLQLIESYQPDLIVSDCASCSAMLKDYPLLFENQPAREDKAKNLAQITFDITEIIDKHIDKLVPKLTAPLRIAWDDPCELFHAQGRTKSPVDSLKKIPGLEIINLPESDWCCGSAGAFMLKYPDIADQILQRKINNIVELKLDFVLTSNPGCYLHLKRGLRREKGTKTKVVYLSEFLMQLKPN